LKARTKDLSRVGSYARIAGEPTDFTCLFSDPGRFFHPEPSAKISVAPSPRTAAMATHGDPEGFGPV
jgi:hypothetical protein